MDPNPLEDRPRPWAAEFIDVPEELLAAMDAGDTQAMNYVFLYAQVNDPVSALMGLAFTATWAIRDAAAMHGRDPADYRQELLAWCRSQRFGDATEEVSSGLQP